MHGSAVLVHCIASWVSVVTFTSVIFKQMPKVKNDPLGENSANLVTRFLAIGDGKGHSIGKVGMATHFMYPLRKNVTPYEEKVIVTLKSCHLNILRTADLGLSFIFRIPTRRSRPPGSPWRRWRRETPESLLPGANVMIFVIFFNWHLYQRFSFEMQQFLKCNNSFQENWFFCRKVLKNRRNWGPFK
jgi:hypothetical protein